MNNVYPLKINTCTLFRSLLEYVEDKGFEQKPIAHMPSHNSDFSTIHLSGLP